MQRRGESFHPLQTVQGFNEVQGSGECLGVLDVEGQGSGESMNHSGLQDMGVQFFAETLSRLSNVEAPRAKNDRSEELSCALLGIEGPLDRDRVLEAVRAIKEPKGSQVRLVQRQAQGTMVIFGAYTHGGCHGITRPTYRRPQLVKLLNRYVSQVAPRAEYSALAVSTGVQLDWHRDCHNLLDSMNWVIPLGRFQGGEIRVLLEGQSQDEADLREHSGFRLDVAQGPVSFNARRRHCVLPFTGDRVVLVGYTPRGFARLSREQVQDLQDAAFPLPTPDVWELRAMLHEADVFSSGDERDPNGIEESLSEGDEVGEASAIEVSQGPGVLSAFCLPVKTLDELRVEVMFLSRVVMQERQATLDQARMSPVGSAPFGDSLVNLEREFCRVLREIEIGQAVRDYDEVEGRFLDHEREARVRLRDLGIDVGSPFEKPSEGCELRAMAVLKGEYEPSRPEGLPEVPEEAEIWYQAQTIDTNTALAEIDKWVPALTEEYTGLTTQYKAIHPIHRSEVSDADVKSGVIEVIPSKVVYTRKPPRGDRRARIVACGNFQGKHPLSSDSHQPESLSRFFLYASGLDSTALRIQLRLAALRLWRTASLDVKKAFLLAPLQGPRMKKKVILQPPKVMHRIGLVPESEVWLVLRAMYGLDISPACWQRYRDGKLSTLRWLHEGTEYELRQSKAEPSLWLVCASGDQAEPPQLYGLIGIYVDDIILSLIESLLTSAITAIQEMWQTSSPKFAVDGFTFLGIDIVELPNGYHLSQGSYVNELLGRHEEVSGRVSTPIVPEKLDSPVSEFGQERVREAQALVGELTWLATKTRLDLAYSVNRAAQLVAKDPSKSVELCLHMIRYLRERPKWGLYYCGTRALEAFSSERCGGLEIQTDSSFAPQGERSQSGIVIVWAGGVIGYHSSRQPFITTSTAESELLAMQEGHLLATSLVPLIQELTGTPRVVALADNIAALTLVLQPSGTWRTRHLRLRAAHIHEQIERELLEYRHRSGTELSADALTKALPNQKLTYLLSLIQFVDMESVLAKTLFISLIMGAKAQPGDMVRHDTTFWIWIAVAFLLGMVFVILVQRLPLLWIRIRGRLQNRTVLAPSEPLSIGSTELHVIGYADDLAVIGPPPEGLRRRGEATGMSLHDAPTYTTEEIEQIFNQWYEQNMEHYDPYDPSLDLSPGRRVDFVDEAYGVESDSHATGSSEQTSSQQAASVLVFAPPSSTFSRNQAASLSSQAASSELVVPPTPSPLRPSEQAPSSVLRLIPNALTPEDWSHWSERVLLGYIPNSKSKEQWEYLPDQGILIRWHGKYRLKFFDPRNVGMPIPIQQLLGLRRSFVEYRDSTKAIFTHYFPSGSPEAPPENMQWRGRSEFLVYTQYEPATVPTYPMISSVPEQQGLSKAAPPKNSPARKAPPAVPAQNLPPPTQPKSKPKPAPKRRPRVEEVD